MKPITIDLTGLQAQFGLASSQVEMLTETCVNMVATAIYANWEALAKQELNSTRAEYLQNLNNVDRGRFSKQIVLSGTLPNMIEQGASPFDMKEGFKKSNKVKYTIPVYDKKGNQVYVGGDWYLTIPFRIGTPGSLGQAGFSGVMPSEVYEVIKGMPSNKPLFKKDIPSPHDVPQSREAILDESGSMLFDEYTHKNSIYEGMTKRTAQYEKTSQNTYGTFRRAGSNSDPMSWIHKGMTAKNLANKAIEMTDVNTIVENEVTNYLEKIL